MTNLVKVHPNERIDLGDFEHAVRSPFDEFQRFNELFVLGAGEMRILDGFEFSVVGPTTAQITLGSALLAEARDGVAHHGQLASEGVAAQNVSFAGLAVATYGVWVRFQYADGEQENRGFWDTNAGVERVQSVATRQVASWTAVVSAASPGAEWYKLYDVEWDGSDLATSTRTDVREFFFESKAPYAQTWGGGDDRNDDRAQYGVKSLERFCAAVLQKLDEIQSGTNPEETHRWWEAPAHGSLDDMLPLSGSVDSSRYMRGPIVPNATGLDLGQSLRRWDAYLNAVSINGNLEMQGANLELISGADILISEGGGISISEGGLFETDGIVKIYGSPSLHLSNSLDSESKIHFYDAGNEANEYFDIKHDAGAGGEAVYDVGKGSFGNGGYHVFRRHGVNILTLDPEGISAADPGVHVHGLDVFDVAGGGRLGNESFPWSEMHAADIYPSGVVHGNLTPNATGTRNLGSSGARWATLYANGINLTDRIIAPEATLEEITSTTNPAATAGYENTLVAKNIPKAWAVVTTNGVGGVTLVDGFNVASAGIVGGGLRITFAEPFSSFNYAAFGTARNITTAAYPTPEIDASDPAFADVRMPSTNLSTQSTRVMLVFFGTQ